MLRLNEHYTSIQGEGPNVGKLTQFVRFSGCNLRCPGWPCDTPHAILPSLWVNDPKVRPEDLAARILETAEMTGAHHICLTGGEPFLQPQDELRQLITELHHLVTVDIFTNGTYTLPPWLISRKDVTIVMDWKLPGSGEPASKFEGSRDLNVSLLRKHHAIKFVVKDQNDLEEAARVTKELQRVECNARLYVGAVWDHMDDHTIVEFIKEHRMPWWLNVQVHKHIWGEQRGV